MSRFLKSIAKVGITLGAGYGAYAAACYIHDNPPVPKVGSDKPKIACVGDSITYGSGVPFTRMQDSYPALLQGFFKNRYQVLNYGLPNRTLCTCGDQPYVLEKMYLATLRVKADKYIIMLGSNDSKPYNFNADKYEEELMQLLNTYIDIAGADNVYVCLPPDIFPDRLTGMIKYDISALNLNDIRLIIKDVASKLHVTYVDLYENTIDHPEYYMDGIHPNAMGNKVIAHKLYQVIK